MTDYFTGYDTNIMAFLSSKNLTITVGCGLLLSLGAMVAQGVADVGISTEEPTATLHVVGEDQATGKDLRIENLDPPAETDALSIIVADQDGYFHATTMDDLAVAIQDRSAAAGDDDWRVSQDNEEMTIDSAIYTKNNVGVGVKVPAYELDVYGDIRATGSLFASNHVITHATFATSDERFKTDIEPYADGLSQVRAMEPKKFRYTADAPISQTGQTYYGLIAQDAARIDPNFVETFNLPQQAAAQGTSEYLAVDSQRLIFTLISAVKEIDQKNQEIDALRARLDALEARMNVANALPVQPANPDSSSLVKSEKEQVSFASPMEPSFTARHQNRPAQPVNPDYVHDIHVDNEPSFANNITNPGGYF